jgi:deoxyribodipyrimidine photolyase
LAQQQQHIELVWFKKDLRVEDHAALTALASQRKLADFCAVFCRIRIGNTRDSGFCVNSPQ